MLSTLGEDVGASRASAEQRLGTPPHLQALDAQVSPPRRWWSRLLSSASTDFCPGANRYVYWLKEPIGWFVVALGISVLVGMHVTPMGWTMASVIGAIIVVGMLWPWIAVRVVHCELNPVIDEVHECEPCELVLSISNKLPLPLWGLAIEGFLDREGDDSTPTTALACVPALCDANYRLAVQPALRGRYPMVKPTVACAFPFGIWTARRQVDQCTPLTVLPLVCVIQDEATVQGGQRADWGDGLRPGSEGEMLGVREFRGGDRLRNVHWVQTARTGNLMVCERGGPEQQTIELSVDLTSQPNAYLDPQLSNRDAVAWRIRVAASLVNHLHARRVPITLKLGDSAALHASGASGLRRMLLAMTDVPADGLSLPEAPHLNQLRSEKLIKPAGSHSSHRGSGQIKIEISSSHDGSLVLIDLHRTSHSFNDSSRGPKTVQSWIDIRHDVASQMLRFWREVEHARIAA